MGKTVNPTWVQGHYRFRNDDGTMATATYIAAEDTSASIAADTNFRLRMSWGESAAQTTSTNSGTITLQFAVNGGGFTTVTGSTAVKFSTSGTVGDASTEATQRLTLPTGVASWGSVAEFDSNNSVAGAVLVDTGREAEFCLQLDSGQLTGGDSITFQLLCGGAAFNSADATPTLTASIPVTHTATGTLSAGTGALSGSANRTSPSVTHDATGTLTAGTGALAGSAARSFAEESWDPANKDADITLSNNDKTATNTANSVNNTAIGETGKSTGKWYFEASTSNVGGGTDSHKVGLVNGSVNPTNYEMGNDANSIGYRGFDGNVNKGGITQATYTAWTTPSTLYRIMVAVDATNEIVWFGLNGTWNGDPAAGTGGIDISSLGGGALKAAVGLYNTSTPAVAMTGAFTASDQTYSAPSGFTAWADSAAPVTHSTTGALVGGGASVAGSSARFRAFATSGVLQGQGSDVTGAAARFRAFDTSGALVGQGSNVTGSANRFRALSTSGALVAGAGALSGTSARSRVRDATGTLTAGTGALSGSASRTGAAVTHDATGALSGGAGALSGTAARIRIRDASGALAGAGANLAGNAARSRVRTASGTLVGVGAMVGAASRTPAAVSHAATGVLAGAGAVLVGAGATPVELTDTQLTEWARRYSGVRRSKG